MAARRNLPRALYRAVIDEAHMRGLRVSAHVFYHDDAVDLVDAGVDAFAHLVRDKEMDDALMAAIVKNECLCDGQPHDARCEPTYAVASALADGRRSDDVAAVASRSRAPVVERMRGVLREARSEGR